MIFKVSGNQYSQSHPSDSLSVKSESFFVQCGMSGTLPIALHASVTEIYITCNVIILSFYLLKLLV